MYWLSDLNVFYHVYKWITCIRPQELLQIHKPEKVQDALLLQKKMLEVAIKEWSNMPPLGSTYSPQLDKDVGCC
jgi:hypothetical protein